MVLGRAVPFSNRFSLRLQQAVWALVLVLLGIAPGRSDSFPAPRLADVNPEGIGGALVIGGGGRLPDSVLDRFLELAGGESARLVVIPTATQRAEEQELETFAGTWSQRGFSTVQVMHTHDRSVADSEEFVGPLMSATAVWFVGGQQSRLAKAYAGTRVEIELRALLARGGVIGGTSAGAAIQSRLMIASGNPVAVVMRGLDLLPGGVVDQHFKVRGREVRLTAVIQQHPGYFGLGIDERTAAVVHGRKIEVVGDSSLTVCLSQSANRPPLSYELRAGELADLTALGRAAIARSQAAFPPQDPVPTRLAAGALMIVGGGRVSLEMWSRFVELAGGSAAQIVVIPTAAEDQRLDSRATVRRLSRAGAKEVTVLHTRDRARADRLDFVEPLRRATGVWFGGGRQWRIVDAYEGTATYRAFHDLLRRGGAIGGSSAGATIQGEYLVRGNPLGNRDMMAEGYERGFAFLPGCAIDQHFVQRGRQADMIALKRTFPQLLGIGIDEATALVVEQTTAQVLGAGQVYFYDSASDDGAVDSRYHALSAGDVYDLLHRQPTRGQ